MTAIPWMHGLRVACPPCGWDGEPSLKVTACPVCKGPLETRYAPDSPARLPIDPRLLTDLGRQPTPLVADPHDANAWLKLESRNPTGSHKDRFHAVCAALARLGGAPGLVTTSTGNHGVACAAHAAREGLRAVVLTTAALPRALAAQITLHGGIVARLDAHGRRRVLRELLDAGWLPATSSDPALSGAGMPYGADGYRALADEIVAALGRLPNAVAVPAASGDTLVGIGRGLVDAAERHGMPMPVILACQPAGAAALAASISEGRPIELAAPISCARSTADGRAGRLAIRLVQERGAAVVVEDAAIVDATRSLAACGFHVETSAALAVAGVRAARDAGLIEDGARAVAVVTAAGRGWNEDEPALLCDTPLKDAEAVLRGARDGDGVIV